MHVQTVDFMLTAHRDVAAARRLFERAIDLQNVPASITIDKSGANTAAMRGLIASRLLLPPGCRIDSWTAQRFNA